MCVSADTYKVITYIYVYIHTCSTHVHICMHVCAMKDLSPYITGVLEPFTGSLGATRGDSAANPPDDIRSRPVLPNGQLTNISDILVHFVLRSNARYLCVYPITCGPI